MHNPIDFSLLNSIAGRAGAMLVVSVPEAGTVPTLVLYFGALGLVAWYFRKRSRRFGA